VVNTAGNTGPAGCPGMDGSRLVTALNREWTALAGTPVAGWADGEPALAGVELLGDVLDAIRRSPDPVLAALLRHGTAGDEPARRAVLQTMLGKLVRLCARRPDTLGEAVSELWLAIADYPLARRPHWIAANRAFTVQRRLARPATDRPVADLDVPAAAAERGAGATLAEARDLGLIDECTHRTLWTVYVAGLSSAQAADVLGTSAEAVRWRCSWALRRLARHAELLAA
jgi:DNA-directed RNA polymerase specialized sigma24 family protein